MANQGAWIGAGAAIAAAVISSAVTLYVSGGGRQGDLETQIQAGFEGLASVTDPSDRIRQLDVLEGLVNAHVVAGWQRLIEDYRQKARADVATQDELDAAEAQQEETETALATALAQAPSDERPDPSTQLGQMIETLEAQIASQSEAIETVQGSLLAAAAEAEEERLRTEAASRASAARLQQELGNQVICQNANCSSWILP